MAGEPEVEPGLHLFQRRTRQLLVGQDADAGRQHMVAGDDLADRLAEPADHAVVGEHIGLVNGLVNALGPPLDFAGQRLERGSVQGSGGLACGLRVRCEAESMELSDVLTFNQYITGCGYFRFKHRVLSQAAHQNARSTVNEPLGEALM